VALTKEQLDAIERKVLEQVPYDHFEDHSSGWYCADKIRTRADLRNDLRKKFTAQAEKGQKSMTKNIYGVNVEIDHPVFKNVRNTEDIKKIGLFDNFTPQEQEEAAQQLLAALNIKDFKKANSADKIKDKVADQDEG
jgi:hypothetical protein